MEVEVIKAKTNFDNSAAVGRKDRLRVAAYCRVSTADEEQIKSYDSMVKYYTDLIKKNPDWKFVEVYADKASTGTKAETRENFQRLIADCMAGKIDMVIAKSLSRFARNTLDTLKYVRQLRTKNVAIYFEVEKINTIKDGEFLLTILSSVAQQEVENTSAYVKKGLKMKMKRGELVGFQGCLGSAVGGRINKTVIGGQGCYNGNMAGFPPPHFRNQSVNESEVGHKIDMHQGLDLVIGLHGIVFPDLGIPAGGGDKEIHRILRIRLPDPAPKHGSIADIQRLPRYLGALALALRSQLLKTLFLSPRKGEPDPGGGIFQSQSASNFTGSSGDHHVPGISIVSHF